jgi:hypothetical protein
MDKKLLDALNNLSFALEELVTSMSESKKDKNKSATSTALTSGKIEKKLELINKGIKDLKSDNKKILKNQEELLKIAKSQKKESVVGDAGDPKQKSKIKDGVATIILIAVGVLAIGLAFKIIGKINIVTVLALAFVLPILAYSFEKIAKSKDLNPKRMEEVTKVIIWMAVAVTGASFILSLMVPLSLPKLISAVLISGAFVGFSYALPNLIKGFKGITATSIKNMVLFGPLVLLTLSLAISLSSWVLQMVKPVGFFKLFTAIMISAAFVGLAYSLPKILKAFKGVEPMSVANMVLFGPLIFVALSAAIAGSSWILQMVKPVGFFKLVTVILISAAFAALGYGLNKILTSFKGIRPDEAAIAAALMPILFVALALAITASSLIFQNIKVVGFFKLLTALIIGVIFIPLAYALPYIAKAIEKIDIKKAWMIPVALVLLATAIMLSSYLFDLTTPIPFMKLLNILFQSILLAAIGFVFSFVISIIAKISIGDMLKGGVVLIGLAAVVMVSSLIFNLGTYENYPGLFWVLGVAASLAAFAFGALTIGALVFGPQALVVAAGLAAILVIAGTIVAASYILNEGSYDAYPGLFWIAGVGASLTVFSALAVALGLTGLLAMIGLPFMISIANTIVEISNILGSGKYDLPGFTSWALSVALLYGVFTPILLILAPIAVANAVASAFGANPWKMAGDMMISIAQTMVDVSNVLAKGNYKGGPTVEWAGGVAIALGAFAPIYGMLVRNKIMEFLGGGGIGPDDFNQAIRTVVGGIQFAADAFAGFAEKAYPKKEWAEGVGLAISSFAPVYDILAKSKDGWLSKGGPTPEEFTRAIMVVCQGILDAAEFFGENIAAFDLSKVPKKEWGESVGGAIKAFSPALEFITKNGKWWKSADPEIIGKAIRATAYGIRDASLILGDGDYTDGVKKEWVDTTSTAIRAYVDLAMWLVKQKGMTRSMNFLHKVSRNISNVSNTLADGTYTNSFTAEWVKMLDDGVTSYVHLAMWVNKQDGVQAAMGFFYNQVTWYILKTSERFSEIGKNMKTVNKNWMTNVSDNVKEYVMLAQWITENNVDSGTIMDTVDSMYKMSFGYSALATSIKKLNSTLEELDVEKLNALRNLNASVVLMSLMDPDQFASMMDELEDKGGVLIDALEGLESKEGEAEKSGKKAAPSPKLKTSTGAVESQKTISDLFGVMQSVESKLAEIAKHSDKLSKYVDEIRGDDNWMRKR